MQVRELRFSYLGMVCYFQSLQKKSKCARVLGAKCEAIVAFFPSFWYCIKITDKNVFGNKETQGGAL